MARVALAPMEGEDYATFSFAAVRGIQAGREYYVAMCPLRLVSKILAYDDEDLPPECRAQRTLNKARVPEIARYIVENPKDYVFSSITASIDGGARFEASAETGPSSKTGRLHIPSSARLLVNDGQHRRAAIVEALKHNPDLGLETLSVVFFLDAGLRHSQQMFADLNQHAVRPTKSLSVLYDHRSPLARLALKVADDVPCFKGYIEFEKTTLSNRSTKLFTLSSVYLATAALLGKRAASPRVSSPEEELAVEFWSEIGSHMPEWCLMAKREISASALRKNYVHAHGVVLHALGLMGRTLVGESPNTWKRKLQGLEGIDWSRSNAKLWEGRAMIGGRLSKAHNSVLLTASVLKKRLGLPLTTEEERLERSAQRARE